MNTRTRYGLFLFLLISLLLVCYPRFNRNDTFLGSWTSKGFAADEKMGDAIQYVRLTQYYRDQPLDAPLRAPFTYRPFVPLLASLLPFDAMTSINIVNLIMLWIALLYLFRLLTRLDVRPKLVMLGCFLFVYSFPTFYYGTIGYTDPALVSCLIIGMYYLVAQRWYTAIFIIALCVCVKETIVILLPVLWVSLPIAKVSVRRQVLLMGVATGLVLISYVTVRMLSPVQTSLSIWAPSLDRLLANASRWRSWVAFMLTFGIPGLLTIAGLIEMKRRASWERLMLPFIAGLIVSLALFGFATLSAYADGRFIWTSYPFTIPFAVYWLDRRTASA